MKYKSRLGMIFNITNFMWLAYAAVFMRPDLEEMRVAENHFVAEHWIKSHDPDQNNIVAILPGCPKIRLISQVQIWSSTLHH